MRFSIRQYQNTNPYRPLSEFDKLNFEYFRNFCVAEFALYFELESWQAIIMQGVYTEACIWHASLAIGALARSRDLPNTKIPIKPTEYGLRQYTLQFKSSTSDWIHQSEAGSWHCLGVSSSFPSKCSSGRTTEYKYISRVPSKS